MPTTQEFWNFAWYPAGRTEQRGGKEGQKGVSECDHGVGRYADTVL